MDSLTLYQQNTFHSEDEYFEEKSIRLICVDT